MGNSYLENSGKAWSLISKIIGTRSVARSMLQQDIFNRIKGLLSSDLLKLVQESNLENEIEICRELQRFSEEIQEYQKYNLLSNKAVVGIGGQFSAGKSAFINSLLNVNLLPEKQTVTTAVSTYVIGGPEDSFFAITEDNRNVQLDEEGMKALTHAFNEEYKIGFSRFIQNLIITKKDFAANRPELRGKIALLDTPGYNKADSSRLEKSDRKQAMEQLNNVDFLIWLIDSSTGVINETDIEFISALDIKNPILFVFNKADLKSEEELQEVLEESQQYLVESGLPLFEDIGVTAYSSVYNQEYLGQNLIQEFFDYATQSANDKENMTNRFKEIVGAINDTLTVQLENITSDKSKIRDIIAEAKDVENIQSILHKYLDLNLQQQNLLSSQKKLENISVEFEKHINKL